MTSSIVAPKKFHVFKECPHCRTKHIAAVYMGHFYGNSGYVSFWGCPQCQHGFCTESDFFTESESDPLRQKTFVMYPQPASPDAPDYTPTQIAEDFRAAKENLFEGRPKPAAIMARTVLDQVMKDVGAQGRSLWEKIAFLEQEHKITPDMKEWADTVRAIGNEAVHDYSPVAPKDAEQAVSFTEMLLTYLYTLPAKVKQHRQSS